MRISHFIFLLMTSLGVYIIFILDQGNDVRQKANLGNFLILIQNGLVCKEDNFNTTGTNTLGPETANEHTAQCSAVMFQEVL